VPLTKNFLNTPTDSVSLGKRLRSSLFFEDLSMEI